MPVVLMHMRGSPQTMTSAEHTLYSADPVHDIAMELQHSAEAAMESGVPAWRIILDPGTSIPSRTIFPSLRFVAGNFKASDLPRHEKCHSRQ